MLTPEQGEPQRAEFCRLVGKSADPDQALASATDELHEALGELESVLAGGEGPVRLDEDGDLVISPLTAEDVPEEAKAPTPCCACSRGAAGPSTASMSSGYGCSSKIFR